MPSAITDEDCSATVNPAAAVKWVQGAKRPQEPLTAAPFHRWATASGEPWVEFHRSVDEYLIRFLQQADFRVAKHTAQVTVHPVPGVAADVLEHLSNNLVAPLARSHMGALTIHASAVEIDDFAVLFAGMSGAGKSTLAAGFAAAGYRFLSDDGAQLELQGVRYAVRPNDSPLRLWRDSLDTFRSAGSLSSRASTDVEKASATMTGGSVFCDEHRPLRHIYFIDREGDDCIGLATLEGQQALAGLLAHSFLLDVAARSRLTRHFAQLARLAAQGICSRLQYPRCFESLPEVRQRVLDHARGIAVAGP